jgi:hypothetical protein
VFPPKSLGAAQRVKPLPLRKVESPHDSDRRSERLITIPPPVVHISPCVAELNLRFAFSAIYSLKNSNVFSSRLRCADRCFD